MNFPGKSIDELVREELPEDDADEISGNEEDEEDEENEEDTANGENGVNEEIESGEDETNDTPEKNRGM